MTQGPPSFPLAPWQMWGTTVIYEAVMGATIIVPSQQLVRVNYKRPETWSFLIGARLIGGTTPAAGGGQLNVHWHVAAGIGRSVWDTQLGSPVGGNGVGESFAEMVWTIPAGTVPGNQLRNNKWTTEVFTPPLDDPREAAGTESRMRVNRIAAQDIQCSATAVVIGAGYVNGDRVRVEIGAFFAPMSHVRPEWFAWEGTQYRGEETGGT